MLNFSKVATILLSISDLLTATCKLKQLPKQDKDVETHSEKHGEGRISDLSIRTIRLTNDIDEATIDLHKGSKLGRELLNRSLRSTPTIVALLNPMSVGLSRTAQRDSSMVLQLFGIECFDLSLKIFLGFSRLNRLSTESFPDPLLEGFVLVHCLRC